MPGIYENVAFVTELRPAVTFRFVPVLSTNRADALTILAADSLRDQTMSLTYNSSGNSIKVESPSGGIQRLGRDSDGRIIAYTNAGNWPTPDTAALWARFRTEALSGSIQKWSVQHYKRLLDIEAAPPAGLYRIVTDEGAGRTWLATPDYQRVAAFKKPAVDPKPSLFSGRLPGKTKLVETLRVGRGKLRWPRADA